jgi:hypothetical protein
MLLHVYLLADKKNIKQPGTTVGHTVILEQNRFKKSQNHVV